MYLIKLASKVEEERIPLIAEKISSSLNIDSAKVEQVLSKELGTIGKAPTKEKAEEIIATFRDVGIEVVLVEDRISARRQISYARNREEVKEETDPSNQAKESDLQYILTIAKRQKVLIYLSLLYLVLGVFNTSIDRDLSRFLIGILTLAFIIFGTHLYWRLYSKSGAVIRIIVSILPFMNILILLMASSKVNKLIKNHGFKVGLGGANIKEIREALSQT